MKKTILLTMLILACSARIWASPSSAAEIKNVENALHTPIVSYYPHVWSHDASIPTPTPTYTNTVTPTGTWNTWTPTATTTNTPTFTSTNTFVQMVEEKNTPIPQFTHPPGYTPNATAVIGVNAWTIESSTVETREVARATAEAYGAAKADGSMANIAAGRIPEVNDTLAADEYGYRVEAELRKYNAATSIFAPVGPLNPLDVYIITPTATVTSTGTINTPTVTSTNTAASVNPLYPNSISGNLNPSGTATVVPLGMYPVTTPGTGNVVPVGALNAAGALKGLNISDSGQLNTYSRIQDGSGNNVSSSAVTNLTLGLGTARGLQVLGDMRLQDGTNSKAVAADNPVPSTLYQALTPVATYNPLYSQDTTTNASVRAVETAVYNVIGKLVLTPAIAVNSWSTNSVRLKDQTGDISGGAVTTIYAAPSDSRGLYMIIKSAFLRGVSLISVTEDEPLPVGGRAVTQYATPVPHGTNRRAVLDTYGRAIIAPCGPRESLTHFYGEAAGTTPLTIHVGGDNLYHDVCQMWLTNQGTGDGEVYLSFGGTNYYSFYMTGVDANHSSVQVGPIEAESLTKTGNIVITGAASMTIHVGTKIQTHP